MLINQKNEQLPAYYGKRNKLVVLHIITSLSTGGAQLMLYHLLHKANRDKITPVVVSLMDRGNLCDRIEELDIPIYTLEMNQGMLDIGAISKLRNVVTQVKPDIIQGWMYHGNLAAQVAKFLTQNRSSTIWGIHHSISSLSSEKVTTQLIIKLGSVLSKYVDKIAFVSKNSQSQHHSLGYTSENSCTIPNGFNTSLFKPSDNLKLKLRKDLGLPPNSILIGSIARYHPMKDHANFVSAADILTRDFPDVHFVMVGTDINKENHQLYQLIQDLGIEQHVHLMGERDDIPDIIPALDILASSSAYGEAFPLVLGEAMCSGVPCAVTDVGDSAWIVGSTGKVVSPGSSKGLANACKDLIVLGSEGRKKLGMMARKRIIEHFSLDSVVAKYEDLYEKVLAN
ncbi:MAG: glycosyltransferase [Cyanobacteria bacterium J06635_10]